MDEISKFLVYLVIFVICVFVRAAKNRKMNSEAKHKAENTTGVRENKCVQQSEVVNKTEPEHDFAEDVLGYVAAYATIRGVQKQLAKIPPKTKNGIVESFDESTVTIKPICEKCGCVSESKVTRWVGSGKNVEGPYDCKKCGKHMYYKIDRR